MRSFKWIAAFAAIGLATSVANADLIADGGYQITHSWTQQWLESEATPFDAFGWVHISGAGLESPELTDFSSASGWAETSGNTNAAVATGTATASEYFTTHFLGSPADPLVYNFYAWANAGTPGETLLGAYTVTWDGGSWGVVPGAAPMTFDQVSSAAAVPLPASSIAGLGLLGALGGLKLARRRKLA